MRFCALSWNGLSPKLLRPCGSKLLPSVHFALASGRFYSVARKETVKEMKMPIYSLPEHVRIKTIKSAQECDQELKSLLAKHVQGPHSQKMAIGMDCEWNFCPETLVRGPVATTQLAFANDVVLVLQLTQMGCLPDALQTLLTSDQIVKVGRHLGGDIAKLQGDYHINGTSKGLLELGKFCRLQGAVDNGSLGLEALCADILKKQLLKPQHIRVGDLWESAELTEEQIQYAAMDAYVGLEIFQSVSSMPSKKLLPGQVVNVLSEDGQVAAVASVVNYFELAHKGVNVTKTRCVVKIQQVLLKDVIAPLDRKSRTFGQLPRDAIIVAPRKSLRILASASPQEESD